MPTILWSSMHLQYAQDNFISYRYCCTNFFGARSPHASYGCASKVLLLTQSLLNVMREQVRLRQNRPTTNDEHAGSVHKLHSEQASTSFIPNKLHSTAYYKETSPRIFDLRERTYFSSSDFQEQPVLFCFCLGIFSLATSLCCLFMLFAFILYSLLDGTG
jgi:hypothetical protein